MRLFDSDFLEFFTHITPAAVLAIWIPVIVLLMVAAVQAAPAGAFPWHIVLGIVLGLLMWSIAEYILHRFLFHYEPTTPRMQKIFFLFHGVHHAQPQDKTRLVMPPVVSIPLALLFYGFFYVVLANLLGAPLWVMPTMVGFIAGYLMYDMIHYATHHFPMRSRLAKYLKRHHMMHHYKDPHARFGVSSPLWDFIFRTMDKAR
ncbi:MAG: sterol desaturase family protein [Anaerolineae bacterium]|nr:sterol desaturase family protein [Anaerolineae bacterium]